MRICIASDLHGKFPDIPDCDVLLIPGDICPTLAQNAHWQYLWMKDAFLPWLKSIDTRKIQVIACAGNHDFVFTNQDYREGITNDFPWIYLQDEGATYNDIKFYGTPWQREFCNWAFNLPENKLSGKFDLIPDGTDVVISHSPPKGFGDYIGVRTGCDDGQIGSLDLRRRVMEIKPKLHAFGHIHCDYGHWDYFGINFVNAAVTRGVDGYPLVREPILVDI